MVAGTISAMVSARVTAAVMSALRILLERTCLFSARLMAEKSPLVCIMLAPARMSSISPHGSEDMLSVEDARNHLMPIDGLFMCAPLSLASSDTMFAVME